MNKGSCFNSKLKFFVGAPVKSILLLIAMIIIVSPAYAATVYMGPSEQYTNLQAAMKGMSGGDTLIIRDGIYTGTSNSITNSVHPPSGSSGSFTTIRAEHPRYVTFDGQGTNNMFYVDGNSAGNVNWVKFSGIIWGRSSSSDVVFIQGTTAIHNSHIYFTQCGFFDGGLAASTSTNGLNIRRTDYALVEDCYVWGELYYGMLMEMCSYSIFRRCVGRYDIHRGARGGIIGVYSSSNMEVQNCIAIDCDQDTYYTAISEYIYAFAYPTTDGASTNIHNRGNIALNLKSTGKIVSGLISSNGGGSGFTFDDVVFWDTSGGFWDRVTGTAFNHCIFGKSGGSGISEGLASDNNGPMNNSIILDNTTYGAKSTSDYNIYYNNGTNFHNSSAGVHDYCSQKSNAINPRANSLLYLTRVESGSNLSNIGSGVERIGPRILNIIGGTGTFYGDTGYNTESSTSLWPFPNEGIIKNQFAAYTGNSHGSAIGARGFCAGTSKDGSAQTLTKYIWEYLGNQIPSSIYGATVDYTSPSSPTGVKARIINQ